MKLQHGVSAFLLLAVSRFGAESKNCAKMFDVPENCRRQTDCNGDGDVVPVAGAHVPDMMIYEDRISMVLVESECWMTVYLNEDYSGPCVTLTGYRCFELELLGAPVGCNGHPTEFPGDHFSAPDGGYARDDVSYRVIDDFRTFDFQHAMQLRAANNTWNDAISSYKCDCLPDRI